MRLADEKNLAGCCGIYCGLCPHFQSKAASKCSGCKILALTLSCKRYNCCVKKHGFETCAECGEFPCDKYEKFFDLDSFVSHKVCLPNLDRIREIGLTGWLREQNKRRLALENLLDSYNEGKSCSFFCVASALLPPEAMTRAVKQAEKTIAAEEVPAGDIKTKARIVRSAIQNAATKAGVDLKLRHKTEE